MKEVIGYMTISEELQSLKAYRYSSRCVLSIYLNTNPTDPEQFKGAWRIELKHGMKRIREYLTASGDEEEVKSFNKVMKKVMNEIEENHKELRKGVVIFASANEDLWSVHYVQVPVKTNFYFENHPVTEQMEYMYKAYPEAGIIMPSFGEIRILDTAMGSVRDELTYKFDQVTEVWKEVKNTDSTVKNAIEKKKTAALEPRQLFNVSSFFRGMDTTVKNLKSKRGWTEFHIAGEAEMANAFADSLREIPTSCIYKNLNNSKTNEIIHQVLEK